MYEPGQDRGGRKARDPGTGRSENSQLLSSNGELSSMGEKTEAASGEPSRMLVILTLSPAWADVSEGAGLTVRSWSI
ncbi:hypothetical protein GCM10010313_19260 [Streptomyces violarus]|nr:hypothetical protein GCM10010313_19260 [Streptomyces violarus]